MYGIRLILLKLFLRSLCNKAVRNEMLHKEKGDTMFLPIPTTNIKYGLKNIDYPVIIIIWII